MIVMGDLAMHDFWRSVIRIAQAEYGDLGAAGSRLALDQTPAIAIYALV